MCKFERKWCVLACCKGSRWYEAHNLIDGFIILLCHTEGLWNSNALTNTASTDAEQTSK